MVSRMASLPSPRACATSVPGLPDRDQRAGTCHECSVNTSSTPTRCGPIVRSDLMLWTSSLWRSSGGVSDEAGLPLGVVADPVTQRGDEGAGEAIRETPECPFVSVPAGAEPIAAGPAPGIADDVRPRPTARGGAQPVIAASPHRHPPTLAAPAGDGPGATSSWPSASWSSRRGASPTVALPTTQAQNGAPAGDRPASH